MFKVSGAEDSDNGIVEKLPYKIVYPRMFKTADTLYSLYVLVREDSKLKLVEISVPDSPLYINKTIDIEDMIKKDYG